MHTRKEIDSEAANKILKRCNEIPVFSTLNISIKTLLDGECIAIVPRHENFDGIFQSYHGGMLMTAADSIAVVALMTKTGVDFEFATTDMNIRLLNKCLTDVLVHARVIKNGRTLSLIHADLYDTENKLVAVAQINYISMPKNRS